MARKKDLCRSSKGVFVRNLGWKTTDSGSYVQHKFYLGRDEAAARLVSLRLERLWSEACKRWDRENLNELNPTDRPVWDAVTLAIAEAIRAGASVARVPLPAPLSAMIPESPLIAIWLQTLQKEITGIKIELLNEQVQSRSEDFAHKEGHRLVDMGRKLLRKSSSSETLFGALDAFREWAVAKYVDLEKKTNQTGAVQKRQIAFIKEHVPDCPLSDLDAARIEELVEILRLRPSGKRGKPVSVAWTQNCLKRFRSFLRWLNRSPDFSWKRPSDLELSPVRIPRASSEKTGVMRSAQVQTYSIEELTLLWTHGTSIQRLLLLLALNCGFGRGEVASLEMADVVLHRKHPHEREIGHPSSEKDSWIFRMRHKTSVYGEFKLWPETALAIEWWLRQRASIDVAPDVTTLLVNRTGRRLDAPTKGNHPNFQIPNLWSRLTANIRKEHSDFRSLSFNKLRKTAGNLIRSISNGEIAAVFLCHGKPVKSDELLDLYTNRPFGKVFEAIDSVGAMLRPAWSGIADPFADDRRETIRTISLQTIRRIQSMKTQGYKTARIAEELNLTQETIRFALKKTTKS